MQRPDNPFLFSISCCSFGDEERDFRRRNSNKALSTPQKDDWAAILNDRTRPVGFTARAAEAAAIRVLTGSIAKSPDGPLGPRTFFKTRALHLRSWLRRRSSSGHELRLAGLPEPVPPRAGPRAL